MEDARRQYRVSVAGPFVTPDLRISVQGPGRYSPAICKGAKRTLVQGSPDKRHVSTS